MKRLIMITCLLTMLIAAPGAAAAQTLLRVAPKTINFGAQPVGIESVQGSTITNISGSDLLVLVEGGLPDDFGFGLLPGSTCPALAPGDILTANESCVVVVRFTPTEFFAGLRQTGTLTVTARDPATGALLAVTSITVRGRGIAG